MGQVKTILIIAFSLFSVPLHASVELSEDEKREQNETIIKDFVEKITPVIESEAVVDEALPSPEDDLRQKECQEEKTASEAEEIQAVEKDNSMEQFLMATLIAQMNRKSQEKDSESKKEEGEDAEKKGWEVIQIPEPTDVDRSTPFDDLPVDTGQNQDYSTQFDYLIEGGGGESQFDIILSD